MTDQRHAREPFFLAAGLIVLLLATISPLAVLGEDLVSAHMVQHLLIALVAPPLLLLGLPASVARHWLQRARAQRIEGILGRPAVAWVAATATLFLWHIPAFYHAAMANDGIHVLQELSVLVTSVMFWWPVVSPLPEKRLPAPVTVLYLVSACAASTVLGILITMVPGTLDAGSMGTVLSTPWGTITPAEDQQVGGLIMWVGCCLIYVVGIMSTLAHWYGATGTDRVSPPIAARRVGPL